MKATQPQSWTEVTHLFEAALELSPDERNAFLERACAGDAQLRREVQSLLEADAYGARPAEAFGRVSLKACYTGHSTLTMAKSRV